MQQHEVEWSVHSFMATEKVCFNVLFNVFKLHFVMLGQKLKYSNKKEECKTCREKYKMCDVRKLHPDVKKKQPQKQYSKN